MISNTIVVIIWLMYLELCLSGWPASGIFGSLVSLSGLTVAKLEHRLRSTNLLLHGLKGFSVFWLSVFVKRSLLRKIIICLAQVSYYILDAPIPLLKGSSWLIIKCPSTHCLWYLLIHLQPKKLTKFLLLLKLIIYFL
jgi:hypothetical protein